MTDEAEVKDPEAPAPKKRRKKMAKRAPRAAAAPKVTGDDRYAGMTVRDCCLGCNAEKCVISGKAYCAHPRKGGLHPNEQSDPAALGRRKEAETRLRNQHLQVQ